MAITSATPVVAPRFNAAVGTAAVVAPYHRCSYTESFARQGWRTVAVELDARHRPPALGGAATAGGYADAVEHRGTLRRTVKLLRGMGVTAVVAGSPAGCELAERIAWQLGLPGADPLTSRLRYDRGAQAAALTRAGIPAPRTFRTTSLAEALAWAEACPLPRYTLAPAVAGTPVESLTCASPLQISAAWLSMKRAAARYSGDAHLVLAEELSARRFVVNCVSRPGWGGRPDHVITDVWAETRTSEGHPDRTDLLNRHDLLSRGLSMYMLRVLDALGVVCGPVTARVAYDRGGGPLLVSALAAPGMSLADEALRRATGRDRGTDALDAWIPLPPKRLVPTPTGHQIVRVHLHPGSSGGIGPRLGNVLRQLPTVVAVGEHVPSHTTVADGSPSGAEVVLSSADPEAVEADYRVIRAFEGEGEGVGGRRR
ncbi:hypothetical protein AB0E10_44070 [Streptomyces sp. NPDC048045]|uniref:hypothetical protein n=1 Tax=Streptomyces sp. NPDC048045 TaxID=3154710 RepID=UPI00343A1BDB